MRARPTRALPARLEGTCRRFERWRRTRKGRSRIPGTLWAAAVKAAGKYGVHRTAKALRLDYYSLKERVEAVGPHVEAAPPRGEAVGSRMGAAGSRSPSDGKTATPRGASDREALAGCAGAATGRGQSDRSAAATFVELAPPPSGGVRECILELEDPGGAKMRVHLKGGEAPDLTVLTRSFWGTAGVSHRDRGEA